MSVNLLSASLIQSKVPDFPEGVASLESSSVPHWSEHVLRLCFYSVTPPLTPELHARMFHSAVSAGTVLPLL